MTMQAKRETLSRREFLAGSVAVGTAIPGLRANAPRIDLG